ncbi:MAG: hypothetical protein Q8R00_01705 [Candidatus Nanoarchaeia archaeon]|nr:hypothetical protein [Candidatus Nanoarchaeia archaeon]
MAQSYENVLRLVLIILLLFFIVSAVRVKEDYALSGNFMGLGTSPYSQDKIGEVDIGATLAQRNGCYDSDGGDNVREVGIVTYRVGKEVYKVIDICQDSKNLIEMVCLGGGKTSSIGTQESSYVRECTYSCENGICVEETFQEGQLRYIK